MIPILCIVVALALIVCDVWGDVLPDWIVDTVEEEN